MKIFFNASSCIVGGGGQVAASLIQASMKDQRHTFRYAISETVRAHLEGLFDPAKMAIVKGRPASLLGGWRCRRSLQEMVRDFSPDVVLTVFGPAYCRFDAVHVCGYARPWDTHPTAEAFSLLSWRQKMSLLVSRRLRRVALRGVDVFWTETEASRRGLAKFAGVPLDRIDVISNCYSPVFAGKKANDLGGRGELFKILSIGSPYVHKRFPFIPDVASELRRRMCSDGIKFLVTLPTHGREVKQFWSRVDRLGVGDMFENLGVLRLSECIEAYQSSDIAFLPTVLETFSVSHLEAMKMELPIVTTDLEFLREVCGDAALYFKPTCPSSAADCILKVKEDVSVRNGLVALGRVVLDRFPSPEQKYQLHIEGLERAVAACRGLATK